MSASILELARVFCLYQKIDISFIDRFRRCLDSTPKRAKMSVTCFPKYKLIQLTAWPFCVGWLILVILPETEQHVNSFDKIYFAMKCTLASLSAACWRRDNSSLTAFTFLASPWEWEWEPWSWLQLEWSWWSWDIMCLVDEWKKKKKKSYWLEVHMVSPSLVSFNKQMLQTVKVEVF